MVAAVLRVVGGPRSALVAVLSLAGLGLLATVATRGVSPISFAAVFLASSATYVALLVAAMYAWEKGSSLYYVWWILLVGVAWFFDSIVPAMRHGVVGFYWNVFLASSLLGVLGLATSAGVSVWAAGLSAFVGMAAPITAIAYHVAGVTGLYGGAAEHIIVIFELVVLAYLVSAKARRLSFPGRAPLAKRGIAWLVALGSLALLLAGWEAVVYPPGRIVPHLASVVRSSLILAAPLAIPLYAIYEGMGWRSLGFMLIFASVVQIARLYGLAVELGVAAGFIATVIVALYVWRRAVLIGLLLASLVVVAAMPLVSYSNYTVTIALPASPTSAASAPGGRGIVLSSEPLRLDVREDTGEVVIGLSLDIMVGGEALSLDKVIVWDPAAPRYSFPGNYWAVPPNIVSIDFRMDPDMASSLITYESCIIQLGEVPSFCKGLWTGSLVVDLTIYHNIFYAAIIPSLALMVAGLIMVVERKNISTRLKNLTRRLLGW